MKPMSALVLIMCCSCSNANDGSLPDASAGQPDGASECALEPRLERTRFEAESVAYLRTSFAVTTGFEGGVITYGETAVPLSDGPCPVADWTALSYTVPVDPARLPVELRATHDRVAAMWSLNGRKAVVVIPADAPHDQFDTWLYGRLPDNFNAVVKQGADPDEVRDVIAQVRALRPALRVEHLEAIGVLTVTSAIGTFADDAIDAVTVPEMDAAAEVVRSSHLFDALDWSGLVLRLPNDSWAPHVVAGALLVPECERVHTRDLRDGGQFTTSPSFAAPLGAGPQEKSPSCD